MSEPYGPPEPGGSTQQPYVPEPRSGAADSPGPVGDPAGPHPKPGPSTPPAARGGDRARPRPAVPRWLSRLPYAFVLCGVAAGLIVVATDHFRRGSMLIAASVFIGALARLVLPESQVGMLAVRRRWLDVFLMTAAAVGITLVAFVAKGTSG
ncbi:DUF3017 domain-containing protein [Actinoallomurus iriomotensis]|uniref:DUF3017 domain-containing protein n=1 Tax=Actinoallomurus iriomotensis TaxID=478107 RepID=A0A9W6VXU3_9ACTN|nr:DUF3017 domain-containing protein [Actinoallomurus iriomotensis]GLY89303.1 hypothetical protein Airi02_072320 [Actinoallomurus iriomotensis]